MRLYSTRACASRTCAVSPGGGGQGRADPEYHESGTRRMILVIHISVIPRPDRTVSDKGKSRTRLLAVRRPLATTALVPRALLAAPCVHRVLRPNKHPALVCAKKVRICNSLDACVARKVLASAQLRWAIWMIQMDEVPPDPADEEKTGRWNGASKSEKTLVPSEQNQPASVRSPTLG